MKNLKIKLLEWLYEKNKVFFQDKVFVHITKQDEEVFKQMALEIFYEKNRHKILDVIVKDFIGYIPTEVNEPAFVILESQSEAFEKWILWQSYYINKKSINDPEKIELYRGMMIYLKVLHTLARVNKKLSAKTPAQVAESKMVDKKPWVEEALQGLNEFNELRNVKKKSSNATENKDSSDENTQKK